MEPSLYTFYALMGLSYTLLGLIIGSFLNVCIYRIPLGKSVVTPRSGCTHCGTQIPFYDNIPVISYLLLRGKCRFCRAAISFRYPFVELLTGAAFLACGLRWNYTSPTYVNSLFLAILIILIFIDYDHRILPDILTIPGTIAGILLCTFQTPEVYENVLPVPLASLFGFSISPTLRPWIGSIMGAIIGGGMLYAVGWAYLKIRKREGLGLGDVKMLLMVGAFIGWPQTYLTIFAGSILGLLAGIYLIIFRKGNLQTMLPFGVFLGMAAALTLFYGRSFLTWYLP